MTRGELHPENARLRAELDQARNDLHKVTQERNEAWSQLGSYRSNLAALGVFALLAGIGLVLGWLWPGLSLR